MSLFTTGADPSIIRGRTLDICNAFTTAPTSARKTLINSLVNQLIVCGAWDRLDFLYVLAAVDGQSANVNWKNPGSLTLVANGSPTFTADRGYTGNGTSAYLATGYNPNTSSLGMGANDMHVGAYTLTTSTNLLSEVASDNSRCNVRIRSGAANSRASLGTNVATNSTVGATPPSYVVGNRIPGDIQPLYVNGALDTAGTSSTYVGMSTSITLLGNPVAGGGQFSDRQTALAHVGRSLTAPQVASMHNAFRTYLLALGAVS
jgi:hypothetical protein